MIAWRRASLCFCTTVILLGSSGVARAQAPERAGAPKVTVPGEVALAALMTVGDAHLRKLADTLGLFAATDEARSADWEVIRGPLGAIAEANVPALVWFALPDGSYWSVQQGRSDANLASRDYFPRVLAGETVLGPLVVSRSTRKSSAIVAVPVRSEAGAVVGVLGASVYLEELSRRLAQELSLGNGMIFFSFDATPLLGLVWDPQLILFDPLELGPEVRAAFEEMLAREQGVVRYRFRDQWRTVLYRRSPVTGWWYAFGLVGARGEAMRR